MEIELHIPTAQSLKERRSFLKGTIEKARDRFNASVIELGSEQGWKRATIAAVCVADGAELARQTLEKVLYHFETSNGITVVDNHIEFL